MLKALRLRLLPLAFVACATSAVTAGTARYTDYGPEPLLANVFEQIEANKWEAALR